jgi:hypothetical protein
MEGRPTELQVESLSSQVWTGRHRNQDGEIHKKRGDTLRKEHGDDFAKGYRSDAKLGTVLKKEGVGTLSELLKKP